jgi:hypothetical protein
VAAVPTGVPPADPTVTPEAGPTAAPAVDAAVDPGPAQDLAAVPGAVGAVDAAPHRPWTRRARAGATDIRRRRALLLAGMGVLTVSGVALAVTGLSTVRNSTAGRYEQAVAPDDPGYQAHVVPTPTMAVLHRGADDALAGAWLLALEPGDDGGSAIAAPPATVVPGTDTTLADVYRDQGPEATAEALGAVVTVAVGEHVEVDDDLWAQLVAPVGPVEVAIDEAVGEWPAGAVTLEPEEVGRFLSALAAGETDLDRLERQQLFWNAWLPLVGAGGDGALPGEVDTGIGRFVRAVALGEGAAAALPVSREEDAGGVRFTTDADRLGDFVAQTVPYPTSAAPGARVRVRLLNGTTDDGLTTEVARALVAGGAEITIAGNAASFDVAETSLVYTGAEHEPLAVLLAERLGGGRIEEVRPGQDGPVASDDEIDVTVILGDDAGDLIGR